MKILSNATYQAMKAEITLLKDRNQAINFKLRTVSAEKTLLNKSIECLKKEVELLRQELS